MLINKDLILLNLPADSQEEALTLLAQRAKELNKIGDVEAFKAAVLAREGEYSTAVGFGVAIPHGKTDAVLEPFLMFARVKPMDWKALDGNPIDLIFLIGVPEKDAGTLHLQVLAALSRKLMKEEFRNAIRLAEIAEGVMEILEASELGI